MNVDLLTTYSTAMYPVRTRNMDLLTEVCLSSGAIYKHGPPDGGPPLAVSKL